MKKHIILTMSLVGMLGTWSIQAWSGASSSSGGGAYVCRNPKGEVTQAILHDLWEHDSRIFPVSRFPERALEIIESDDPVEVQLALALNKIRIVDNIFADKVERMLTHVQNEANWWLVPDEIIIPTPSDARNEYQPKNCPLEGMFLFHDDTNTLAIKPELQMSLRNNTHIAAAWMHEAVYKVLRTPYIYSGNSYNEHTILEMNSSYPARKLNACLFSNNTFDKKCFGQTPEVPADAKWECNADGIKFYLGQKQPGSEKYELSMRKYRNKSVRAWTINMEMSCYLSTRAYYIQTAITPFSPAKTIFNDGNMYGAIEGIGIDCDENRRPMEPFTINVSIYDSELSKPDNKFKAICQQLNK